jgi:hypothetical protein
MGEHLNVPRKWRSDESLIITDPRSLIHGGKAQHGPASIPSRPHLCHMCRLIWTRYIVTRYKTKDKIHIIIYICTYNYTTYIIRHMVHRDCFCPWTRACEIELLSGNRLRKTSHYAATLYARICWNMLNIAGSMFLDLVWSSLSACWMGLLTAARYVRNSGFRCISASFRSPQRCNENLTHGTFAWGLRWSKTKTFEDHAYRYSAFLCPQSIYVGGAYPD